MSGSGVPPLLGARFYYDCLSPQCKKIYDALFMQQLRQDFSGRLEFVPENPVCAASDVFESYKALRDDHPEFFWLGHQPELFRKGNAHILKYPVLYSAGQVVRIQRQLHNTIGEMTAGTKGLPVLERERIVYERIARKMHYKNNDDVRDHSAVGPALMNGEGVCEGLNALLMLSLRMVRIPSVKIYGKMASGAWHCWSIVWLGRYPTHLDVTWDIPISGSGIVRYNYFNLSDRQISAKHLDFRGKNIPVCAEEGLSYYRQKGLCATSRETLTRMLGRMKKTGAPVLAQLVYTSGKDELTKEIRAAIRAAGLSFRVQFYPCPGPQTVLIVKT